MRNFVKCSVAKQIMKEKTHTRRCANLEGHHFIIYKRDSL